MGETITIRRHTHDSRWLIVYIVMWGLQKLLKIYLESGIGQSRTSERKLSPHNSAEIDRWTPPL